MSEPGWYDTDDGRRRWWDGEAWGGYSEPAETFRRPLRTDLMPPPDLTKWEQAPDGSWHRIPEPPDRTPMVLAALVLVAALVGGGLWWNWKQDQDRIDAESDALTCQLIGGANC